MMKSDYMLDQASRGFSLTEYVPYRISMVAGRMRGAHSAAIGQRFGLNVAEWRVIMAIGEFSPLTATSICEFTTTEKAEISRTLSRLISQGLVHRVQDKNDRRQALLSFTEKGKGLHNELKKFAVEWERQVLAPLKDGEKRMLLNMIKRLDGHIASMAAS